jgi:hypothetical protein
MLSHIRNYSEAFMVFFRNSKVMLDEFFFRVILIAHRIPENLQMDTVLSEIKIWSAKYLT